MDEILTYTSKNEIPDLEDALEKLNKTGNEMSPEEKKTFEFVINRIDNELLPAQAEFHEEWDDAKKIFEAYIEPDPLKESFTVPLSHMIIDSALAEEIDAFPDFEIGVQEPNDRQKLPMLNAAKKYALARANWDRIKLDALRIRRVYGFCPVRIYYCRETRKIKQRVPVQGDSGIKLAYKETIDFPWDDIRFEVIDNPRRFLIDDNARDIEDAEDCALITEVNWNIYRQKFQNDVRYKNLDMVAPKMRDHSDVELYGEALVPEQRTIDRNNTKVRIIEYWNKYLDMYITIANGVIIRETCLVDDHKELPFAVLHMYRRPHTFYSKGVPKLIESLEAPYNAIMRAEVRATKLAFPILVTDDDSAIDPRQIAPYPGVVLEGGMDKTELLQLGTVPNEVYRMKDKLEELLIWTTGINFKQIFGSESERVGIEALKKESMLSRVNANLRENESNFIVRLGNMLLQDIMQYYPVPKVRMLMPGETPDDFESDHLVKDPFGEVKGVLEDRIIPIEGVDLHETMDKKKGLFTLTASGIGMDSHIIARPEYIRVHGKMDIRAVRPSALGSSKEAKKLTFLELSDHAMQVNTQGGGIDPVTGQPTGNPIWDQRYIEEQLAEAHDLPVEKAIMNKKDEGNVSAEDEISQIGEQFNQSFKIPTKQEFQQVQQQEGQVAQQQDNTQSFLNSA